MNKFRNKFGLIREVPRIGIAHFVIQIHSLFGNCMSGSERKLQRVRVPRNWLL